MVDKDIRWVQRFSNYKKALAKLTEAVNMDFDALSELEMEGVIQRFEYTYELAWKTLQDFLRIHGYPGVKGAGTVLDQAIESGYLLNGEGWKEMKASRELTSHTYDEVTAKHIARDTAGLYHALFIQLETRLEVERLR